MDEIDELDAFRAVYATPEPPSDEVRIQQRKRLAMMTGPDNTLTSSPAPLATRTRTRRRVIAVVAPLAVAAMAAGTWAATRTPATEVISVSCIDGTATEPSSVAVIGNDGSDPVQRCAEVFQIPAEDLQPCVDLNGAVQVIKAAEPEACQAAGLAPWDTRSIDTEAVGAVRTASISFHDRYNATGNGCATVDDWMSALEPLTSTDPAWTVAVNQVESNRTCYDAGSINPVSRTIELIGVPGEYSIGCDPRTGC
ncbi:MAG: hypothetical protein M9952_07005 [Microthrixaceae bacterium]|nr:hypothetical protein [Microthrixaceae bacterium]